MRGGRGQCTSGYLESSQVGSPCVHVVCPFTIDRLGLSVPDKVCIQITIIYLKLIPNNLILLEILFCRF